MPSKKNSLAIKLSKARRLSKELRYVYLEDGLISIHNHDFIKDPHFISAYQRGIQANGYDFHWKWRVHTVLWAASHAANLDGDFVECGVNRGFLSSSIMEYLNWNDLNKKFYLLDTFQGIDEDQLSEEEIALGRIDENRARYSECYQDVKKNFKEFNNVVVIKGAIPYTLDRLKKVKKISYLSIDMNNAKPEIAAIKFFWPKLVSGGIIILDDYAGFGFLPQKKAFDQFAKDMEVRILSLPTGQGLFIK